MAAGRGEVVMVEVVKEEVEMVEAMAAGKEEVEMVEVVKEEGEMVEAMAAGKEAAAMVVVNLTQSRLRTKSFLQRFACN